MGDEMIITSENYTYEVLPDCITITDKDGGGQVRRAMWATTHDGYRVIYEMPCIDYESIDALNEAGFYICDKLQES